MKSSIEYKNIASEIKNQQFHKTYDIILSKHNYEDVNDEWRFIRKQHLEYPNYNMQISEEEMKKYHEFNFKKKITKNESKESSPHKSKDLPSFLKSVFSNNEEVKEAIMLMRDLTELSVDYRMLYTLRENLIKVSKENHNEQLTVDDFRKAWLGLMKLEKQDQHPYLEHKILHIITDETGQFINIKKFSSIVDLSEFYPLVVKKNKNFSEELYYALSSGTVKDHSQGLELLRKEKQ